MKVIKSQDGLFVGKVEGLLVKGNVVNGILSNCEIVLGKYESEERAKAVISSINKYPASYDIVNGKRREVYNSVFVMPQK